VPIEGGASTPRFPRPIAAALFMTTICGDLGKPQRYAPSGEGFSPRGDDANDARVVRVGRGRPPHRRGTRRHRRSLASNPRQENCSMMQGTNGAIRVHGRTGTQRGHTESGLTKTAFARLVGVSVRAVTQWTSERRKVPGPVAAYVKLLLSLRGRSDFDRRDRFRRASAKFRTACQGHTNSSLQLPRAAANP
jgi:hypothetical protein